MKKTLTRQQAEAMLAVAKDNVATMERYDATGGVNYNRNVALVAKLEKMLAR